MKQNNIHIGLRIRQIREEKGMKLLEFADAVGIDNSSMGKIEKGMKELPLRVLLEISSKFSVSADWVLNGGDRTAYESNKSMSKEDILLNILETSVNTKAYEKANAEMIKEVYKIVSKTSEATVNAKFSTLLERFLIEEARGLQ